MNLDENPITNAVPHILLLVLDKAPCDHVLVS